MIPDSVRKAFRDTPERVAAVHNLWRWTRGELNTFHSQFYKVIHLATASQLEALFTAFPNEVTCYLDWIEWHDPDVFFKGVSNETRSAY